MFFFSFFFFGIKIRLPGLEKKMSQRLSTLDVIAKDWSLVSRTQVRQPTIVCKSSSKGTGVLFCSLLIPLLTSIYLHTDTPTYTELKQVSVKNKSTMRSKDIQDLIIIQ